MRGSQSGASHAWWSDVSPRARDLGWMLLLGAGYYVAARLSLRFALIERNITPLWPPTGIALVAFLRIGRRLWPAVAIAALLVNVPISASVLAAAITAVGNTAAPFVGAWLLQRVDFHLEIDRIRDVAAIVALAALLSMVISATIGAGTLVVTGSIPAHRFWPAWSVWWAGDAMGVLIVAPFLLWLTGLSFATRAGLARQLEAALLFAALIAVSLLTVTSPVQLFFLVPPVVGWIAWRYQQSGAAPAALVVSCIATWAAVGGRGPFSETSLFQKMLLLQGFNATVAFTGFFLAALVLERIRSSRALEAAAEELGGRVRQRTTELAEAQEMARIGRWEWTLATNVVTWSDEMFRIHGALPGSYPVSFEKAVELVVEEDRDRIERNVREALERGSSEVPDIEYQIVRPDGELRVLFGKARIFPNGEGAPERMVGVVQDITERREYQRQHEIADTLQRALLPRQLPSVDGFELAARYLPAEAGLSAGGDWYDVVSLPSGSVSVVIGDVAGHGLEAASVMGQLRLAIRAYAVEGRPPAAVVGLADSLLQEIAPEMMVTMLYLSIDGDTLEATAVNAGHPPFLVISEAGARFPSSAPAPPLGLSRFPRYEETIEQLEPGTTLLLYTDGLIDRPDLPIVEGMRRLSALGSGQAALGTEELCDRVLDELAAGNLGDDVALLAVRMVPVGDRVHLRIPASPAELARIRRVLSRWLTASGVSREASGDVVLAVSEACANAVKHAYGPGAGEVAVDGTLDGSSVVVTVRDFGRWRPARPGDGGRGIALIEATMTSVDIDRGPEGTEVTMRLDVREPELAR